MEPDKKVIELKRYRLDQIVSKFEKIHPPPKPKNIEEYNYYHTLKYIWAKRQYELIYGEDVKD